MDRIVSLTDEQMDKVISEWNKEYQLKSDGGCLCGSYICNLDELGCLSLDVHCRKSNSCPTGQDWIIEDSIVLFNQNLVGEDNCILNECDFEDMGKELKQIGILDSSQSDILRDTARNSFIRDYSYGGSSDEFGNNIREKRQLEELLCKKFNNDLNVKFSLNQIIKAYTESDSTIIDFLNKL